jgi:hypothetical protein
MGEARKFTYDPTIFDVGSMQQARWVAVSPDGVRTSEARWEIETEYLMEIVDACLPPRDATALDRHRAKSSPVGDLHRRGDEHRAPFGASGSSCRSIGPSPSLASSHRPTRPMTAAPGTVVLQMFRNVELVIWSSFAITWRSAESAAETIA